ncbi:MAG: hypothetical protein M1838_000445 [Thelocarpon superellum]|nr:MAG: hypothetical protein M1838_000445 [Thelocarpon superellum]
MALGNGSFSTFLILCPTSFFLGMLFSAFPYDYPILWTSVAATAEYYDQLEQHISFIHQSPPIIPRLLNIMIGVGLLGFITKLYKPSEANMLFDGASLVLYMVAIVVYITNVVKGMRVVSTQAYGTELVQGEDLIAQRATGESLSREDSLRVMSASHTILALVLVGVLVLQAGQWYAEHKERQEIQKLDRQAAQQAAAAASGSASPTEGKKGNGHGANHRGGNGSSKKKQ